MSIDYNPQATVDIDDAARSIAVDLSPAMATAFLHRLTDTLVGLEAFPHSGSPVDPPYPNCPGMRCRAVKKFTARVVYYVPTPTGIRVVRVLHAHQDTAGAFGD